MRSKFIFESREEGIKHLRSIARGFAEHITPIYRFLNWTNFSWLGEFPSVDELEKDLLGLINSVEEYINDSNFEHQVSSGTGGMVVECTKWDETETEAEFYEMEMKLEIDHSLLFGYILGEGYEDEEEDE